jgi:hypothetical protein
MEYDWFWVILAVGVFAAVAIAPLSWRLMLIGVGATSLDAATTAISAGFQRFDG